VAARRARRRSGGLAQGRVLIIRVGADVGRRRGGDKTVDGDRSDESQFFGLGLHVLVEAILRQVRGELQHGLAVGLLVNCAGRGSEVGHVGETCAPAACRHSRAIYTA